jgi:hypothetical protein
LLKNLNGWHINVKNASLSKADTSTGIDFFQEAISTSNVEQTA